MIKRLLFLSLPFVILACQEKPVDELAQESDIQTVSFRLTDYAGDHIDTRTSYESTSSGFVFNWAEGDAVGIVSPEGSQLKFPIKEEFYGQHYADFDGRGFALVANTNYASYYPFLPDFDLNPAAVPLTYEGQVSVGDNDLSHLGTFSYSVAQGVSPAAGKLEFTFLNIGSPHRYRMPALAGNYKGLTLSISEEKYILDGTVSLLAEDEASLIAISTTRASDTMSLDLTGTTMSDMGVLRCWMMMPPANLSGDIIHMTLTLEDGTSLLASVNGVDYPANYRKVFNSLTSVYPAESEVSSGTETVQIKLLRTSATDAVTISIGSDWLTESENVTDGLVTTYTFNVAENEGAAREGTISFTETSTGLTNTVTVKQQKAGTVIGIGGWSTDSHTGTAN